MFKTARNLSPPNIFEQFYLFGDFNGCDFYLRSISVQYAKIAVEVFVMQLEIIYALREQMFLRFQMREILKFILRTKRIK